MPRCPQCQMELATIRQREGIYYLCRSCNGRAVTLPQIRRTAGDRFTTNLLRQINTNPCLGARPCPFCNRRMRSFSSPSPIIELDACKTCGAVWFDPLEFEAVPASAVESVNELQLRSAEAIGMERLRQIREKGITEEGPDETWKTIPALFGFPIETGMSPLSTCPWLTWTLALLIGLVSVLAFSNLEAVVEQFGFVPADVFRLGGLTSLTSFFLHGGVWHLFGNLYFLLIFGDNVEDFLGRRRTVLLILAATFAGDLVHWLAQPNSTTPCIGASGGISGIIAYYALQFPQARLGFLFRYFIYFRWLQVPAWSALVLWLLLQFVGVFMELSGFSNVAATAHLGGAGVGFFAWIIWRKLERTVA